MWTATHRPLTWESLTEPSKVMIPVYVGAQLWLGTAYVFDDGPRKSAALALARMIMDMTWWGFLYWGGAAALVAAFLTHRRSLFALVLYMVMVAALGWSAICGGAMWVSPDAPASAPVYPLVFAAACFSTARAVLSRKQQT